MNKDYIIKNLVELSKQLAQELTALKVDIQKKSPTHSEKLFQESLLDARRRYMQDIQSLRSNSTQNNPSKSKSKLIFSKSFGNPNAISENKEHEFARNHTIVHLKSNSICTWIPKNSCSNFRYSLAVSNGAISGVREIDWIHKNNSSFVATNKELLSSNYAFVVLRNPFKRLLSFYCDKLCNENVSGRDTSYNTAKTLLGTSDTTTFAEFIGILWKNPLLKKKNKHIRDQCDFLIYKNYTEYFSVEKYAYMASSLHNAIGLKLEDVRPFNSVITTYGCTECKDFNYDTPAKTIGLALANSKKPISTNMYNNDLIQKVGSLYFEDILLYTKTIISGEDEMLYWINHMF